MKKLTTALQLLMCWLLVQPSSQASLHADAGKAAKGRTAENTEKNICNMLTSDAPYWCTCNDNNMYKAKNSSCIMLNTLKIDDPLWKDIVATQPSLERLDINSRVNMSFVPTKTLRALKHLTHIKLRNLAIEELAEKAFSDIPSLVEIDASKCGIVRMMTYAFGNMTRLGAIYLNDNRIHEVTKDVFVNLPSLRTLTIKRNNLTLVRENAFQYLATLDTLDLSENRIAVITGETFAGLSNLTHLNLSNNQIEMIGGETFSDLPELQQLQLSDNRIKLIDNGAFAGLENLRELYLNRNNLVTLGAKVLSATPSLNFLDLSNNELQTITLEHVAGIVQELYNATGQLHLYGNKFICNCNLAWIFGIIKDLSSTAVRDSLGSITCFQESGTTGADAYEVGNNETEFDVTESSGEYEVNTAKDPSMEKEVYDYDNTTTTPRIKTGKLQKVDGKLGYIKQISEFKYTDLPCPKDEPAGSGPSPSFQGRGANATGSANHLTFGFTHIFTVLITLAVL